MNFFFSSDTSLTSNGGSKICLECKITRFFPKPNGLDWDDRGHLVASTSILGYRIHVGVDWWTQKFCPRPPSAPKVDQKLVQNPKILDFAWRAYRFLEIVPYLHLFISRKETSIARRERLRMICKTQIGHKIHVRIVWWTFFLHPRPPWCRNGGSKICLEWKKNKIFTENPRVWVRLTRPPECFYIQSGA